MIKGQRLILTAVLALGLMVPAAPAAFADFAGPYGSSVECNEARDKFIARGRNVTSGCYQKGDPVWWFNWQP